MTDAQKITKLALKWLRDFNESGWGNDIYAKAMRNAAYEVLDVIGEGK